ncbi:probable glutamate receptor [Zootermopsis nevadensis]|uniref:probable glutamate receptor n=1 Tax=Zootermopsis nevadensis TaxID=136037 RepID=UPI000B8E8F1B|nr:probable glutamate receptor [Zootermopsis nevadensis]
MRNCVTVVVFVLHVAFCFCVRTSGVVAALQRYFYTECVFLLHNEDHGLTTTSTLAQWQLQLSSELCPSSVQFRLNSTQTFSTCQRSRPLFVLHPGDPTRIKPFLQFAANRSFSRVIWLLFLDKNSSLEELFTDINIPFDCEFLVAQPEDDHAVGLTEVYRVSPTLPLQTYRFGNWTPDGGLTWPSRGFYHRRNSLQGLVLKTAVIDAFYTNVVEESNNKPIKISGFFGEMWNTLEDQLKFKSDFYKPLDNFFGAPTENGSWNGMIGMLHRGEADFAVAKFVMSPARLQAVDFISTLEQVKTRLFIKEQRALLVKWDEFLRPFTRRLWMLQLFSMILIGLCFGVTYHVGQRLGLEAGVASVLQNLYDALFYTFASFCQQGRSVTPRMLSCRVVFLTSYFTAVVLLAGYSAFLISFLATRETKEFPFTSFKQFLDDGRFQLGMLSDSAFTFYFENSTDPVMQNIYQKMIAPNRHNFPFSDDEGFRRVCNVPNYAYITYTDLEYQETGTLSCGLTEIPQIYIPGSLAITTVKKSPYKGIFNSVIWKMKRNGILKRLHTMFYPIKVPISEIPRPVVYLVQVTPVLTLLGAATLVAIVLLLVENKAAYIKACLQIGRQRMNQLLFGLILVSPTHARKRRQT